MTSTESPQYIIELRSFGDLMEHVGPFTKEEANDLTRTLTCEWSIHRISRDPGEWARS